MAFPAPFFPPPQFNLAPNPNIYLLRGDYILFYTAELHTGIARYLLADRRCDEVKFVLHRGIGEALDTVEVFCAHDNLFNNHNLPVGQNWWFAANDWAHRPYINNSPMTFMFLFEDDIAGEDMDIKFNTYVEFMVPDVTIVSDGLRRSNFHALLMTHYDDFRMLELRSGSQNVMWFYYKRNKISVEVVTNVNVSFMDMKRVPSAPLFPAMPWRNGFI